ncbi:cell death activator cide-3-like [Plakobranchus ocellatus]|uniref:Cell death activator cide-3-like n=1 Tax=Plakobranchus ocellatus TaxID=259542 RepID=A0AAV4CAG7_9GAST|nr:cell death activator cide-3-like [Plakobranchus ocellatus]
MSQKSNPSRGQQGYHDTYGGSDDECAEEIIVEKPDEETHVKAKVQEETSVDENTQVKRVSDQCTPRPFKVWNVDRTLKKSIMASSLHDLIQKACGKFNKSGTPQVVLEEDGTEIEDEDYFSSLPDNSIFQILGSDEKWQPARKDE